MALFGDVDFGTATGLAYRHDWNAERRNLIAQEQLDRQSKLDASNRAKLFADELETTAVSNPWDNTQLQNFYQKRFKDIGKFVSENPDFRQDPSLFIQYNNMTRNLLDNEFVQKGMRIKSHRDNMNKWASNSKNLFPGAEDHLNQKRTEYANYVATGSIDGITGNKQEFIWSAPQDEVNLSEIFQNTGSAFGDFDFIQKGDGTVVSNPNQVSLLKAATSTYRDNKAAIEDRWRELGGADSGYATPLEFTAAQIRPFIEDQYQRGFAPQTAGRGAGGGQIGFNNPWRDFYDTPQGMLPADLSKNLTVTNGAGEIKPNNETFILFNSVNESTGQSESRNIKLNLPNKFYKGAATNHYVNLDAQGNPTAKGTKYLQYVLRVPKEDIGTQAKELIDGGLVNDVDFFGNPFVKDHGDLGEGFFPNVISEDKEDTDFYNITLYSPVEDNQTFENQFNVKMEGQKDAVYRIGDLQRIPKVRGLVSQFGEGQVIDAIQQLMVRKNMSQQQAIDELFKIQQNAQR